MRKGHLGRGTHLALILVQHESFMTTALLDLDELYAIEVSSTSEMGTLTLSCRDSPAFK